MNEQIKPSDALKAVIAKHQRGGGPGGVAGDCLFKKGFYERGRGPGRCALRHFVQAEPV